MCCCCSCSGVLLVLAGTAIPVVEYRNGFKLSTGCVWLAVVSAWHSSAVDAVAVAAGLYWLLGCGTAARLLSHARVVPVLRSIIVHGIMTTLFFLGYVVLLSIWS